MNATAKCVLVAALAVSPLAAAQAPEPTRLIAPLPPGAIFGPHDPPRLTPAPPARIAAVHLTDGWGNEIPLAAGGGDAVNLPALPQGWYSATVELQTPQGPATQTLAFTILPPCDLATTPSSPFGAMTHFSAAWEPDLIAPLAQAGIKNVRDEIFWDAVETEKGVFVFPDRFETYRRLLAENHIIPLTPLSFGNRHYDATPGVPTWAAAPYTDAGLAAYARYAQQVLKHYGRDIESVEVWNEYNGGFARGPADGKPETYARMLKQAYAAIKADRPDVKVLGCSTVGIPLDWIEQVFQAGGIQAMDALSIHPYGYLQPPENLAPRLQALKSLIRHYNQGRDMPIWVTEQGWYTLARDSQGNRDPITEMTKACYLVRAWTIFLSEGIEKSFWYLARNDAAFGTMGLFGKPDDPAGRYAPKPALTAYATLIRQLNTARFLSRDPAPEAVHSYLFKSGQDDLRVLWATTAQNLALRSTEPLLVTDMLGGSRLVYPVASQVHLYASAAPLYVRGTVSAIAAGKVATISFAPRPAQDEDLLVRASLAGPRPPTPPLRFRVAGQARTIVDDDPVSFELGPVPAAEERWLPFELVAGERIIYFGIGHCLPQPAVQLDRFPRMTSPTTVSAMLSNHSAVRSFTLRSLRATIAGQAQTIVAAWADLPAGSQRSISLVAAGLPPFTLREVTLEASFAGQDEPLKAEAQISYNPLAYRTIKVDGDLSDWKGLPAIDLAAAPYKKLEAAHAGDRDLSGQVYLACDNDNLYFAARIQDDVFDQQHTGYGVWKGDNIQLGFSASPPWTGGEWTQGVQELGLTLTRRGPEAFRFGGPGQDGVLKDVPLVVRRQGELTLYECAIPWRELTPDGKARGLSFGLFVNDADGAGRRGYKQWADIKQLNHMQWLTLEKP